MTYIIPLLATKLQVKLYVFISFSLLLLCAIYSFPKSGFRRVVSIIICHILRFYVCQKSKEYQILCNIELFRGNI